MTAAWSEVPYSGDRVHATLQACEQVVRTWGTSQLVRKMARDISNQVHANSAAEEARAVQMWVHSHVKYRRDPQDAELIQDPITTVKNGGDCDDMAICAAALLRAIGHDARVATVQWQGRNEPSHAVAYDLTCGLVVDPVPEIWPEQWPPAGFELKALRYLDNDGNQITLDGLFSKLVKALAKPFEKIFPPKTLLGKIMDPLGLNDPKRNLNLTGRVADVVGTAAAVATGAYFAGVAVAGSAAAGSSAAATTGFWATAGLGASTTAAWLGTKLAVTAGGLVVAGLLAKAQAGQQLSPAEQQQINQYAGENPGQIPQQYLGNSGGSAGDYAGWTPADNPRKTIDSFPIVPVVIGATVLFMILKK